MTRQSIKPSATKVLSLFQETIELSIVTGEMTFEEDEK
jgi:hypothetical protein